MPIEFRSHTRLKCVGQWEGIRREIVGMKDMGGRGADADKLGSRQLYIQKAGE